MSAVVAAPAAPDDSLRPEDWRDLVWLLDVLDEWLLYAEPSTIRELDRLLRSIDATAGSPAVIARLSDLRRRLRRRRTE